VHVRMAIDAGCRLAINTDAHHPDHLLFRIFGVGTARRGWAPNRSIINAWSLEEVREWLDQRRAPHSLRNR